MTGERGRREFEAVAYFADRQPFWTGLHQQAVGRQPSFVGKGLEGSHGNYVFHTLENIKLFFMVIKRRRCCHESRSLAPSALIIVFGPMERQPGSKTPEERTIAVVRVGSECASCCTYATSASAGTPSARPSIACCYRHWHGYCILPCTSRAAEWRSRWRRASM